MQTDNIFIAHPTTTDQLNALKAVVKALKVKFELKKENPYDIPVEVQELVLNRMKTAKPKDYITVEESNKKLKKKYGF
jgi:hypothetical protein